MSIQYETTQNTIVQTTFDNWASSYDHERLRRLISDLIDHAVVNAIPRAKSHPRNILDIGCGTGRSLSYMAKCFPQAQLAGVDPSHGMIDVARSKLALSSYCDLRVAYAHATTFPENYFDLAFSTISFHYWTNPIESLKEIHNVVCPGGFFLLADGFRDLLGSLPRVYFKYARPDARVYSAEELDQMFREASWHVLRQRHVWELGGSILITVGEKT